MDHDSIPMSNLSQSPPQAPPGVDPEVLSKINALFETPEAIVTPSPRRLPTETAKKMEAWWASTGAPSAERVVGVVVDKEQHEVQNGVQDQGGNEEQSADVNSAADEEDHLEFNDIDFFNLTLEDDIVPTFSFTTWIICTLPGQLTYLSHRLSLSTLRHPRLLHATSTRLSANQAHFHQYHPNWVRHGRRYLT
jgi:hypothetical protein